MSQTHSVEGRLREWCPYVMNQSIYAGFTACLVTATLTSGCCIYTQLKPAFETWQFSVCVCECVVCRVTARWSLTQAGRDPLDVAGFGISEPFICWPLDSTSGTSGFLLVLTFCLWSRFAAAVWSQQTTCCQVVTQEVSWTLIHAYIMRQIKCLHRP